MKKTYLVHIQKEHQKYFDLFATQMNITYEIAFEYSISNAYYATCTDDQYKLIEFAFHRL